MKLGNYKINKIIAICMLGLSSLSASLATQRVDDPTACEDAISFAKTLPFAMGVVIGDDSNLGSAIFLNETTALTCAHTFVGRSNATNFIVEANEVTLLYTKAGDYDCIATLNQIMQSKLAYSIIGAVYSLGTFTKEAPETIDVMKLLPETIENLIEEFKNPEEFVFCKNIIPLNQINYKLIGQDLAIIKLKKPILLSKNTVGIRSITAQELVKMPAYSFGFCQDLRKSDGSVRTPSKRTSTGLSTSLACTSICPYNLRYFEKTSVYYSTFHSVGGYDNCFLCEELPALETNRFIGLLGAGMSGGPLLFRDEAGDYILGGINSQSCCSIVNSILSASISWIRENADNLDAYDRIVMLNRQYSFSILLNQNVPLYNCFQGLTSETIQKINEVAQTEISLSITEAEELYQEALKFRDRRMVGYSQVESVNLAEIRFLHLAKTGNVKAMHNYAIIQNGKKKYNLAYYWFQKAADLGLEASKKNCLLLIEKEQVKLDGSNTLLI